MFKGEIWDKFTEFTCESEEWVLKISKNERGKLPQNFTNKHDSWLITCDKLSKITQW